jgi:hypothetical protein
MVAGAVAGNISPEATSPFGNIFADATRGMRQGDWRIVQWRIGTSLGRHEII